MLRFAHCTVACLAVLLGGIMASAAENDVRPEAGDVVEHRTNTGHRFHYMQIKKAKEVAIIVTWPTDWIERGGAVAVPYIGSRLMLSSGAAERDAAALAADFQDLNAVGDLDASADHIWGKLTAAPENLAEAASLGRDVLVEPHLDDRWRKRIQRRFKADQAETHKQLSSKTWDTVRRFVLDDRPLNDFLTLRPASLIDDVTLADIKTWHAETFTTGGIEITAAGPAGATQVADAIDLLLEGLPAGEGDDRAGAAETDTAAGFVGKTILLHQPDAEKTLVGVIGSMPSTRESGQFFDTFASRVLGGGQQSRLFDAIRTRLRASYNLGAGTENYVRDIRLIYLYGEVDDRRLDDVYPAFRDVYETLRIDGIEADEFERSKEAIAANFREAKKKPKVMARLLMDFVLDDDPLIDRAAELPEVIEAFTLDEVNTAIGERLPAFDEMVRIVTTPKDDAIDADCVISSVAEVERCHE